MGLEVSDGLGQNLGEEGGLASDEQCAGNVEQWRGPVVTILVGAIGGAARRVDLA